MNRSLPTILLATILFAPFAASAAMISLKPTTTGANQEFPIEVRISPEGMHLNAFEGTIYIPDGITVTRVSTGGSALTLWPAQPTFSRSTSEVSFVGGIPGKGLAPDSDALLFTIYVEAPASGTYTLTPSALSGFKADGTGTRVALDTAPVTLPVGPATTQKTVVPADTSAPYGVVAVVGSDTSLFNGAPFVSFYGSDEGTGIAKFEAREGWLAPYHTIDRYYVLKDMKKNTPVWVRATDGAGNSHAVHVPGTGDVQYYAVFVAPFVFALLLIGFIVWKRRSRS